MIKNSDIFVFLDNVKFQKQSWQMRNRLKTRSKNEQSELWILIPTNLSKTNTVIKDVLIDNSQDWKQKHLDYFQTNYGSEYREISFLEELYKRDWEKIADFNIEFITQCCHYLEIYTKIVRASELDVHGKKSHLVLDICKKMNATEFMPNEGSKIYLEKDKEIFERENIKIAYHRYKHPKYKQEGEIFLEKLSILDLLFSEHENSKQFI